jgi:predicted DNA-binding transcriptional regulator AlpA
MNCFIAILALPKIFLICLPIFLGQMNLWKVLDFFLDYSGTEMRINSSWLKIRHVTVIVGVRRRCILSMITKSLKRTFPSLPIEVDNSSIGKVDSPIGKEGGKFF